jgi:hypothetical protein
MGGWTRQCAICSNRAQSLSQSEHIAIIGDVIGRPLRIDEISPENTRIELLALIPAAVIVDVLSTPGSRPSVSPRS